MRSVARRWRQSHRRGCRKGCQHSPWRPRTGIRRWHWWMRRPAWNNRQGDDEQGAWGGRWRELVDGLPRIETRAKCDCGRDEPPDPAGDHGPLKWTGAVVLGGKRFPLALRFKSGLGFTEPIRCID